jgi:hypothetical protein
MILKQEIGFVLDLSLAESYIYGTATIHDKSYSINIQQATQQLVVLPICTPPGTFFAVIGISLGFSDPVAAQYIGFILHVITGMVAGNIFGQISLFWSKVAPYNSKEGIVKGMIVGMALWAMLFVPLATAGIQPRLDSFAFSAPNQYIYNIADHFQGLYSIIIGGSLVFHLIYGALTGFVSGRMAEIGIFIKIKNNAIVKP